MAALIEMPHVVECTVAGCSYNHDGCTAFAVTIDGDADCATFIDIAARGGLDKVVAQVGACQRTTCAFNSSSSARPRPSGSAPAAARRTASRTPSAEPPALSQTHDAPGAHEARARRAAWGRNEETLSRRLSKWDDAPGSAPATVRALA